MRCNGCHRSILGLAAKKCATEESFQIYQWSDFLFFGISQRICSQEHKSIFRKTQHPLSSLQLLLLPYVLTMPTLFKLLEQNRKWAEETAKADPTYFPSLAAQQSPDHLWIGCSDSRVAANQITGLKPGEVFVTRNIANLAVHTDLNVLR